MQNKIYTKSIEIWNIGSHNSTRQHSLNSATPIASVTAMDTHDMITAAIRHLDVFLDGTPWFIETWSSSSFIKSKSNNNGSQT